MNICLTCPIPETNFTTEPITIQVFDYTFNLESVLIIVALSLISLIIAFSLYHNNRKEANG